MKLVIGGCRGTAPVAQAGFLEFGGETTAFLIEGEGGERVLIDAGTGVRALGRRLEASAARRVLMLFTHYHLDHVAGLPSLGLLYQPDWTIEMASPRRGGHLVGDVIPRLMHKPFWPLQVEDLASRISFHSLRGAVSTMPRQHGGLEIRWCPVHHPDGCTAYRIDEPATGASCVIATDMEWPASDEAERAQFRALCSTPRRPGLLVMDGQYEPAEYATRRGWGHTPWTDVVDQARTVGAEDLIITHHDPMRDDAALTLRESAVKARWARGALAREGAEIGVSAT